MAERTIFIFAKSDVSITRVLGGGPPVQGDVIGNALNGNASSWENPSDLTLTFSGAPVAISFDDADGILTDDPFSGSTVIDQRLIQPVTINGVTYTPNTETTRWRNPAPVNVENEYEVTLFDGNGTAYRMVGVSITRGYVTDVVGVTFDGPAPPPGTTLRYIQGVSSYGGSGQSVVIPDAVVCFLTGTRIETPDGPRKIEDLRAGMAVMTLQGGPQPIRWIGQSTVCGLGPLAPVCIGAGAFGARRDLYLSPNHRVLLRSVAAELCFGAGEVLVPAKALIGANAVRCVPMVRATYHHLMLDAHHTVFSEGIATESLFAGEMVLDVAEAGTMADLRRVLHETGPVSGALSHMSLTVSEARYLLRVSGRDDFAGVPFEASQDMRAHEFFENILKCA